MKKCLVISALGKESFSKEQIEKLEAVAEVKFVKRYDGYTNIDEFINIAKEYSILGITRRPLKDLGKEIISKLPKLEGIAIYTTGYDWIDIEYIKSRGIKVSYLPDYSTISVAEHSIGLLLTMSRRIHMSYDYARERIDKTISLRGFEINGKSVGIIGYGRIGKKIEEMLRGFGVTVSFYDIKDKYKIEHNYKEREDLLVNSDIIFLTASKTRDELPIIGNAEIEMMKNGVVLINASRADLVDNIAILNGLRIKKIFGYGVDDKIELFKRDDIEYGRIVETSHTAWYSNEVLTRGTNEWVENIFGLITGKYRNLIGVIND